MAWKIDFALTATEQLGDLGRAEAKRITSFLKKRIAPLEDPRSIGKALSGPLGDFWCYRAGNYRLICDILDQAVKIVVVQIGHRSDVYRKH